MENLTIQELLEVSPIHTEFVRLLKKYKILEKIASPNNTFKYTVFAPKNKQFLSKAFENKIKKVKRKERPGFLYNLLSNHIFLEIKHKNKKEFTTIHLKSIKSEKITPLMKQTRRIKLANGVVYITDQIID
jgi:uncharacterized surface protein with fasciclin (FAS1) repeats